MQQNVMVHYNKSNIEKISGAQDFTLIFSVSFVLFWKSFQPVIPDLKPLHF